MKAITMIITGMVMGATIVYGGTYEVPKVKKDTEVILGHRIAPNGVEIIVTK
ncbi:hypothetical protein FDJ06_gp002 [Pseudomonas phage SL2]|uniref:Uncharacterized protein n=1 Tax=Pseudomonas phage SL2 TaxID=2041345 RepID=A0A2D1GQB6_9CAUD|nr:hypothetical protein FDJ06_gp002 [Pseudomonas phage SL2]ATN94579.1 hypothetical protein SL2_002 [Pseudomonas phage SL2]